MKRESFINTNSILCSFSLILSLLLSFYFLTTFFAELVSPVTAALILVVLGAVNGYIFGGNVKLSIIVFIVLLEMLVIVIMFFFFTMGPTESVGPNPDAHGITPTGVIILLSLLIGSLLMISSISLIIYIPARFVHAYRLKLEEKGRQKVINSNLRY